MNLCKNCGAILPANEQAVCPACGAEQNTGTQKAAAAQTTHRKKADRVIPALATVATVLAVMLCALCIAATFLYTKYSPENTYKQLGTALLSGDTATLREMIEYAGTATDSDLQALCLEFSTQEKVDALLNQLAAQAKNESADNRYPALSASSKKAFMGYSAYKMKAAPVSVLVPSPVNQPLLTVDGVAMTGEAREDGTLYSGIFPGVHKLVMSAQSGTGERILGAETSVPIFTAEPVPFNGALNLANITIDGCVSDAAIIYINNVEVPQRPVNLVVTLPQVLLGGTVSMKYTADYGAVTTASVAFSDMAQTALSFTNHVTEGGVPSEEQMNSLLGSYYASFLDSVNSQDIGKLLSSTQLNRDRLAQVLSTEDNKANLFVFGSAACRYDSIAQGTFEGKPSLTCNATFKYTFNNRKTNKEGSRESRQACELIFTDGAWQINRAAAVNDVDFDANVFANLG